MEINLDGCKQQLTENIETGKDLITNKSFVKDSGVFGIMVNGETKDLSSPLKDGDQVETLNFSKPEGKYLFWHTTAHILAQAVMRLFPDALPTIGPPIEIGCYYDFANLKLSEDDFPKLEEEMKKIIKENYSMQRMDYLSKDVALQEFKSNKFKVELINSFDEGLSAYTQGEFTDLCRGPHLPSVGLVKSFKIMRTSGAYWRGDHTKEQLTRIYVVSYPDNKQLKAHLSFLEEAKKRDHRILGQKLDLFSFQEEAPGMPFFHPAGMNIWKSLMKFWHEMHVKADYVEIKTPIMLSQELWKRSGHWENYRENMYTSDIDDRHYAIKPMNCPGCMLFFKNGQYSYRQLPLKVAEVGNVHRHELSGALSGLFRVRSFHQDDSHVFMRETDIENEIIGILNLAKKIYAIFGLGYKIELSTRPEKSIGTDKQWEIATEGLRNALEKNNIEYKLNEGDGAFYGPKIDLHIQDAIGRTWQCGTIQLDMMLPEKFDLEFDDEDGTKKRPIMLHRTILGSIERYLGILIEHFSGRFPLWLSPRQIMVVPIADRHNEYAEQVHKFFEENHFLSQIDDSSESVNKKIRNAQRMQTNYMLVVGDKEVETSTVTLRTRNGQVLPDLKTELILTKFKEETESLSLNSVYED